MATTWLDDERIPADDPAHDLLDDPAHDPADDPAHDLLDDAHRPLGAAPSESRAAPGGAPAWAGRRPR